VMVTSVLQTTAGKMIFGRLHEETGEGSGSTERNGLSSNVARRPQHNSPPAHPREVRPSVISRAHSDDLTVE
ncbi:MAG: hypothetical protein ACRD63_07155, partial [Pyrinomonadaceae bacterium]